MSLSLHVVRKSLLAVLANVIVFAANLFVLIDISSIDSFESRALPQCSGVGLHMGNHLTLMPVALPTSPFHALVYAISLIVNHLVSL